MAVGAGIRVNQRELQTYSVRLTFVAPRMIVNIEKATHVTARKIKDQARKNVRWSVGRRLALLPLTINYDIRRTGVSIGAEIGYDRDKPQGNLAHLIEYGNGGRGMYPVANAPQRNLGKALDQFEDDYINGLRMAVVRGFNF